MTRFIDDLKLECQQLKKENQELREEIERLKKLAYIDLNNLPKREPHIVIDEDRLIDDD